MPASDPVTHQPPYTLPLLTGEHLRRAASRHPAKTALIMGERRIDFGLLDRTSNRVANALIALQLTKGSHVATFSPTVPDYPAVYYGAARSGAVCLNLSIRLTERDIARLIAAADIRLMFVGPGMLETAAAGRALSGRDVCFVVFEGSPPDHLENAGSFAEFIASAPESPPEVNLAPDDPYLMILSGGTTGTPKLIEIDHMAASLWAIGAVHGFELTTDDIYAVPVPLFHGAGLSIWLAAALMVGGTCVLMAGWDPGGFIDDVEAHGVTAAILVPTQINGLLRSPAFDAARLRTLTKINHAGMPMPVALLRRAAAALPHAAFTNNFGSSETGPLTARLHAHLPEKEASVGRPLFTVELAVIGRDGNRLPPGEPGEIATRGAHVMRGYFGNPEATLDARRPGGWHATGDIGYFDEEGFLYLIDRSKDVIIAGGENIYPNEIEGALYDHPAVAEAAAFGIPDETWGEVPAAHVILKEGATATEEELIDFVAAQIPRHKRPRLIRFVDQLPKTAVGKIQKTAIRAPYWENTNRKI